MAAPRVATCIFCDDIRHEVGGKMSVMGIYGRDIIFPSQPPVTVLKWGVVVWLITDIDDKPRRIKIRVLYSPDRTELASFETNEPPKIESSADATKSNFRLVIALPPVNLTEEGFVEVIVDTERETMRAGRLLVRFLPPEPSPPSASTPSA
jgi:hypothetical protein